MPHAVFAMPVLQIVIMELHTVLANPQFQAQLVDYAKQACGLIATLAEQCRADVDQYSPMVFGMVLAYLQPEQVRVFRLICCAFCQAAVACMQEAVAMHP